GGAGGGAHVRGPRGRRSRLRDDGGGRDRPPSRGPRGPDVLPLLGGVPGEVRGRSRSIRPPGVVRHSRDMDEDERLLRRAEKALTQIKVARGLSNEHASLLAALRMRLTG